MWAVVWGEGMFSCLVDCTVFWGGDTRGIVYGIADHGNGDYRVSDYQSLMIWVLIVRMWLVTWQSSTLSQLYWHSLRTTDEFLFDKSSFTMSFYQSIAKIFFFPEISSCCDFIKSTVLWHFRCVHRFSVNSCVFHLSKLLFYFAKCRKKANKSEPVSQYSFRFLQQNLKEKKRNKRQMTEWSDFSCQTYL